MSIISVFIEEGCITCDACEEAAPDVFEVTDDTCFIKPDARLDGGFDRNDGKAGLKPAVIESLEDDIYDAADACPVDVIIVVEASSGEAEASPAIEPEAQEATPEEPEAQAEASAPAEGLDDLLSSGDRTLDILFGSQSGNSEGLAAKISKQAKAFGLEGTVHDMDGFDFNSLSAKKRVLIVCSTWGEGEMPDNAEDLWQFANSDSASRLDGVHFSVCALGDTSYEFFCESGKDWDGRFEALGATRVVPRVDCDVDYDAPAAEWTMEALPALAAVDDTGTFHEDMVEAIKNYASGGDSGADGEDGFSLPKVVSEPIQVEMTVFRYDPTSESTGTDTWICALPGHMSLLSALRALKDSQDGSLTFRDGAPGDPNTAVSVNGRLVLPGLTRVDAVAPLRNGSVSLRIEPLPGFDVIRDLAIDPWSLERKRESSEPWMMTATREGSDTPQGPIGTMDPNVSAHLHSICNFQSQNLLHASSDAVPHANGYLGPAVLARTWSRRIDPRTAPSKQASIDALIGSRNGIKAETDLAPIRRQTSNPPAVSAALLDARNSALTKDAFNGRHGKHVWWYAWTVKSSGKVNDTVIYRQVLGPAGLIGNLISGVTARMVLGFTRTGGNMFNGMLGMVAPPAGIGKMPKQFNSSVDKHHEVVAIFNELDGRF